MHNTAYAMQKTQAPRLHATTSCRLAFLHVTHIVHDESCNAAMQARVDVLHHDLYNIISILY